MKAWLQPSIDKRITEVTEHCCNDEDINKTFNQISYIVKSIREHLPIDNRKCLIELEGIINSHSNLIIELAYKSGFCDGINISKGIN